MKYLFIISLFFCSLVPLNAQKLSKTEELIKQGAELHDKEQYKEAISAYQEALRINPSSITAIYEMSLSYLKMKDYANAIKYSNQIINLKYKPLLVDAYIVKGTALADQGKLTEAVTLFKAALAKDGDEYLLHYNLGLAYFQNKDINNATIHLKKAIELDPTHADPFYLYAYCLKDKGDWLGSVYAFNFFMLIEPNTQRSAQAFKQMYSILEGLTPETKTRYLTHNESKVLLNKIQAVKPKLNFNENKYEFFRKSMDIIFDSMDDVRKTKSNEENQDFFWSFFVPIYGEIHDSSHFDTYCHYIASSYFIESMNWWKENPTEVENFKLWFETGSDGNE